MSPGDAGRGGGRWRRVVGTGSSVARSTRTAVPGGWIRAVMTLGGFALVGPGVVSAQDRPEPRFDAEVRGDSVVLTFEVPFGWALYAPALGGPDGGPGTAPPDPLPVGLPLRVLADGNEVTPVRWPEPVVRATVLGTARVHEAGRHVGTFGLVPGGAFDIEWALCSDTLCIPGRTTVRF